MKTIKFIRKLTLVALSLIAFVSCDDNDDDVKQRSIAEIAIATPDLSNLVAALTRADLVGAVSGSGSLTVFAPTNAAFNTFLTANGFTNANGEPDLTAVPVPALRQVLLNHVIGEKLPAASLTTGYKKTEATYAATEGLNLDMFINTANNGIRLNGVSSVTTLNNIEASNGVIHVVDAVIGLPTVVTFATADPNFSSLVGALTSGTPATDFAGILGRTEGENDDDFNPPFTVFAPTNAAFTAYGTLPGASTLTSVLLHHVARGNTRSSALTPNGNTEVATLVDQDLRITLPGTGGNIANVRDGAGNTNIGIIIVDVQASNGVIHVLNKIALPTFN